MYVRALTSYVRPVARYMAGVSCTTINSKFHTCVDALRIDDESRIECISLIYGVQYALLPNQSLQKPVKGMKCSPLRPKLSFGFGVGSNKHTHYIYTYCTPYILC